MEENSRIILYKGIDGKPEIAIKCSLNECYNWGGLGVCDLCNSISKYVYLCPELGSKGLCQECFDEHKTRCQWYEEDKEFIIDDLKVFICYYKLSFNETDKKLINEFLKSIDSKETFESLNRG